MHMRYVSETRNSLCVNKPKQQFRSTNDKELKEKNTVYGGRTKRTHKARNMTLVIIVGFKVIL